MKPAKGTKGALWSILAVITAVMLFLPGCGQRTYAEDELRPVTGEEFCHAANAKGFFVKDQTNTEQVRKLGNVNNYYVVTGEGYKIEFIIFADIKSAQNNFGSFTQGVDTTKGDYTYGKNYDIYEFKEDTPYYYILRVEHTLYFCEADPDKLETVTGLLAMLGY